MVEELKKRVMRKSTHVFLAELDKIGSNISDAYKIGERFVGRSKTDVDVLTYQEICERICEALSIFADVTDWLSDVISIDRKSHIRGKIKLETGWISVARAIMKALGELTYAYTTYNDSMGMEGDCSISNLFLNVRRHEGERRPYFPDSLTRAAEILFKNGELELAKQYALLSSIEAIWDQYRYEKDDVFEALMTIPWQFEDQKRYDESVDYIIRLLDWLYEFYSRWRGQEYEELYIQQLQYELRDRLGSVTEETLQKVIGFFQRIIATISKTNWEVDEFVLLSATDVLKKLDRVDDASKLVRTALDLAIENSKETASLDRPRLEGILRRIRNLVDLALDLKEQNFEALKNDFDRLKSEHLEHSVSQLACYLGYGEKGERVWKFKNPILHEFMKSKNNDSVEIDVHQYRTEHVSGKERRVIFAAECRFRERRAKARDVEFFRQKMADLYEQLKGQDESFPEKTTPRLDTLWFVSVNGFDKKVLARPFKVRDCKIELVDRIKLNRLLKDNNLREIAIR